MIRNISSRELAQIKQIRDDRRAREEAEAKREAEAQYQRENAERLAQEARERELKQIKADNQKALAVFKLILDRTKAPVRDTYTSEFPRQSDQDVRYVRAELNAEWSIVYPYRTRNGDDPARFRLECSTNAAGKQRPGRYKLGKRAVLAVLGRVTPHAERRAAQKASYAERNAKLKARDDLVEAERNRLVAAWREAAKDAVVNLTGDLDDRTLSVCVAAAPGRTLKVGSMLVVAALTDGGAVNPRRSGFTLPSHDYARGNNWRFPVYTAQESVQICTVMAQAILRKDGRPGA